MAMSVQPNEQSLWDCVLEMTKAAQEKNSDPIVWAVQLTSTLNSAGVPLPSTHLAYVLISHICWDNHVPIAWKFLEKALHVGIVPPCLVLALLSSRFTYNFFFLIKCIYIFFSCLNWIAFSFFWNLFIHLDYLLSCYLFYEFLAKLFYFLLFCWLHCMWDIPVNRNNKKKKKK